MPRGPRRRPPVTTAAPKRSRRTGSVGAGAGVLRNAPGTGRTGVVAAILCNVLSNLSDTARRSRGSVERVLCLFKDRTKGRRRRATAVEAEAEAAHRTRAVSLRKGVAEWNDRSSDYFGINGSKTGGWERASRSGGRNCRVRWIVGTGFKDGSWTMRLQDRIKDRPTSQLQLQEVPLAR